MSVIKMAKDFLFLFTVNRFMAMESDSRVDSIKLGIRSSDVALFTLHT